MINLMDWFLAKVQLVDVEAEEEKSVYFKEIRMFADCKLIIDHYKLGAVCIFQLDSMDNPDAQGMVNYVYGGIYALGGEVEKVGENVFVTVR